MVDRPHTSPQPTRGDGQLKKMYNIVGLQNGNVTCGHNRMVPDDSHAQILQIQSLDIFSLGASFQRFMTMKFGQTAPSRDTSAQLYPFYKIARKGGKTSGTFTLQTHERPKMKVFLKTPSKFASKN